MSRRPARIQDVAELAGVSPALVSRLLNGDPRLSVRPETRAQVTAAVEELGYVPRSAAAALRRDRADAIGLVLDRVTNPVFADLVHGAEQAAAEVGCALLLLDAHDGAHAPDALTRVVRSRRVDGLLVQGGFGPGSDAVSRVTAEIPSVVVNAPGDDHASGVMVQDADATRLATEHLLALGHRTICFVGGAPGFASDSRRQGYEAALRAAGVDPRPELMVGNGWQPEDGRAAVDEVMSAPGPPVTACVAATAVLALGFVSGLAGRGLQAPDDVSVAAVHDPWFAPYLAPALTTVALPLAELGRRAVHQLLEHLASGRPEDTTVTAPAPRLVVRASTGVPPDAARVARRPHPRVGRARRDGRR